MAFAPQVFQDGDIDELVKMLRPGKLVALDQPVVLQGPKGNVAMDTLPLREFRTGNRIRTICDVIENPPNVNLQEVARLLREKKYEDLPSILQPRVMPACVVKVQFVIVPDDTDTIAKQIFKHYTFDQMPGDVAAEMCHGRPHILRYLTANPITTNEVLQWMLDRMGGLRLLWWRNNAPVEEDDEARALDAGYDFIEASDVMDMSPFLQQRWVNKNITVLPDSPIYKWKQIVVEKAIKALLQQGSLAKVRKDYVLTLMSLDPHFLRYGIGPVIRTSKNHGLLLLGAANAGKTVVGIVVSLMFSRYYVHKFSIEKDASMRTAPDLDFFRGNPGNMSTPFVFDDSDINMVEVAKLKAFLDVGEEEAMTRE